MAGGLIARPCAVRSRVPGWEGGGGGEGGGLPSPGTLRLSCVLLLCSVPPGPPGVSPAPRMSPCLWGESKVCPEAPRREMLPCPRCSPRWPSCLRWPFGQEEAWGVRCGDRDGDRDRDVTDGDGTWPMEAPGLPSLDRGRVPGGRGS